MINLLDAGIPILKSLFEHENYVKCYITKRLTGFECSENCNVCAIVPNKTKRSTHFEQLKEFIIDDNHLDTIISGLPSELLLVSNKFQDLIERIFGVDSLDHYMTEPVNKRYTHNIHGFMNDVNSIINYSYLNNLEPTNLYSLYHLAENLGVRSCTYCNRTYTIARTTSNKGKLMRPQFDHWFPKSKHPLLAISFYNLIPCCSYCNSSVKGAIILDLDNHIHPYIVESNLDSFEFGYFYSSVNNKYRIFIKKPFAASGKSLVTLKKLKIDEMYNAHHSELEDLIKIKQAYSDQYIEKMGQFFPKTGLGKNEIFRLLFGTELDSKDFQKRPLSKFKYDILKELGFIS